MQKLKISGDTIIRLPDGTTITVEKKKEKGCRGQYYVAVQHKKRYVAMGYNGTLLSLGIRGANENDDLHSEPLGLLIKGKVMYINPESVPADINVYSSAGGKFLGVGKVGWEK